MTIVYSYTMLNTWTICPHQCARRFIIKDIPYEETAAMRWGNDVHSALETRIAHKKPLPNGYDVNGIYHADEDMSQWEPLVAPLDRKAIAPELRLGITSDGHYCDFFGRNVWLRGKIDVPIVNGTTAIILDWKTGKEREDPFELEVGAMLLKARRPKLETIVGRYVWLRDCKLGTEHDCSDTERTWASVNRISSEIEQTMLSASGYTATGQENKCGSFFPKTPGPLCGWCPVMDCEHNKREK